MLTIEDAVGDETAGIVWFTTFRSDGFAVSAV
jgi:hypothetical protein